MVDTHLRCEVCGRTSSTGFASSLATGWEKCHGYTMTLVCTEADIEQAVAQVMGPGVRVHPAVADDRPTIAQIKRLAGEGEPHTPGGETGG